VCKETAGHGEAEVRVPRTVKLLIE